MPFNIAAVLISLAVSLLLMPLLIKLFARRSLIDKVERRKIHDREVPTMGGAGFVGAFAITILLMGSFEQLSLHRVELLTISVMFVVGLRDDLIELNAISKLIAQLVPAILLIFLTNLVFPSLYGFLGINEIPYWLGALISLLTIIGLTNSYNLIDGLDGLAGSLAVLAAILLGAWFYVQGETYYAFIAFAFVGSLFGFLYYNWQPAKIFMGDTGALVIGFLLSVLSIRFIDLNASLPAGSLLKFTSGVSVAVSISIIPIFDTLRIITVRLLKRKSPFSPDKNHTHHILLRLGFSHATATLLLVVVNILFVGIAVALDFLGDNLLMPLLIALAVGFSLVLKHYIDKKASQRKYTGKDATLAVIKSSRQAS